MELISQGSGAPASFHKGEQVEWTDRVSERMKNTTGAMLVELGWLLVVAEQRCFGPWFVHMYRSLSFILGMTIGQERTFNSPRICELLATAQRTLAFDKQKR